MAQVHPLNVCMDTVPHQGPRYATMEPIAMPEKPCKFGKYPAMRDLDAAGN